VVVIFISLLMFMGRRADRTPRPVSVVASLHRPSMISAMILAMMLAWALPAAAENYHVNGQTGNDAGQGTSTEPFRSFKRAISLLMPGDRLIVASGRYTNPLIMTKSGTAQQPVIIVGEGRPLIETEDGPIQISGSYVEISGFEAHALRLSSAIAVGKRNHHVRIADNIARDSGCAGIELIHTDYVIIENNRVFGNARRSPWQCSGISIYQAINFDHAEGIHNIIRRNIAYDNMNIVVDNKISHSGGKTTDGNGIIVDDTRHTQGGLTDPVYDGMTLIENNIVFDNGGRGIHVFTSDHVVVRNNTSYRNVKDPNIEGLQNQYQSEFMAHYASDVRFVNNIAVPRDKTIFGFLDAQTDGNSVWDFNLVQGGAILHGLDSRKGWGRHNIFETADVEFVAPSVDPQIANFHLRQSSRALGTANVSDAPSQDFSGAPRPRLGPIDLGALQTSVARTNRGK
jgi:parallel beta-helix repeat protein